MKKRGVGGGRNPGSPSHRRKDTLIAAIVSNEMQESEEVHLIN